MVKYIGEKDYEHGSKEKIGVLITNLGTPDAPNRKELKVYLNQFLSDPRVIELPKILWQILLKLVILQVRPSKSAEAYKQIWTDKGSPLLDIANRQLSKIQSSFSSKSENIVFEVGMRYGNPSIPNALLKLQNKQVRRLLVLPMYPQYCAATTGSTFDEVTNVLQKWRWIPEMRFINQYFEEKDDWILFNCLFAMSKSGEPLLVQICLYASADLDGLICKITNFNKICHKILGNSITLGSDKN